MAEFILGLIRIEKIFEYLFKELGKIGTVQTAHQKIIEVDERVSRVLPYVDAALPLMEIDVPDKFAKAVELGLKVTGDLAAIRDAGDLQDFVDDVAGAFGIQEYLARQSDSADIEHLQAELNAVKG